MREQLFTTRETNEFSLRRALIGAAEGTLAKTYEGGMLREFSQVTGKPVTENGFFLPFEVLRRDLTAASASGAALIGTSTPFALDVLRPYAATLRSGAQMMKFKGDVSVPKVAAPSTVTWLEDEFSAITESQATLGELALSPKDAAILTQVSAKMTRQADIDTFLRRELLRSMGGALDQAIFSGSGVSGQPHGIIGTTGTGGVSGASLDWDGVTDMLWSVAEADGQEGVAWFAPPSVRRLLSRRERIAGGGREIWNDNSIAGYPAIASRVAPADTLIVGAFGEVVIALFVDGIEIVVNPYSDFTRGLISYRAWLSVDVAVTAPAAFAVAEGIS